MAGGELSDAAYLQGTPCPKCGHVRTAADTNPGWQCPKCHIAYAKHGVPASKLGARVVQETRQLAEEGVSDGSTYSLIAVNLFAGAIVVAFRMDLRDLLLVYWAQSIVIGLSFFVRMLSVKRYATLGGTEHHPEFVVAAEGDRSGKVHAALFFLVIFCLVHAAYFAFLTGFGARIAAHEATGLALCTLAFATNHAYSLVRNIRLDRGGIANLGLLGFLPYLRVVPMQAVALLGAYVAVGTGLMLVFVGLKSAVDVLTHLMEHHEWRREGPPRVPSALQGPEPPRW